MEIYPNTFHSQRNLWRRAALIAQDPSLTYKRMAKILGISVRSFQNRISYAKRRGFSIPKRQTRKDPICRKRISNAIRLNWAARKVKRESFLLDALDKPMSINELETKVSVPKNAISKALHRLRDNGKVKWFHLCGRGIVYGGYELFDGVCDQEIWYKPEHFAEAARIIIKSLPKKLTVGQKRAIGRHIKYLKYLDRNLWDRLNEFVYSAPIGEKGSLHRLESPKIASFFEVISYWIRLGVRRLIRNLF